MSYQNMTDEALAAATTAGRDEQAFTEMARRWYGRLYISALSIARDPEIAEDITQETFLRAWLKLDNLRNPDVLLPWLCRISRNTAMQWRRDGQQRSRLLPLVPMEEITVDPADSKTPDPRRAAQQSERDQQLAEAVMELPDEMRQAVLLHYTEDLNASDIARMNGESPSTVTRRLEKAREQLRTHFESGLAASLAMMKPQPRQMQRALGAIAAAIALPAATRAQLLKLAADTPPPPMVDPVNQAATAATIKGAGTMKTIFADSVAKWLLAGATAMLIGGGAFAVKSNADNDISAKSQYDKVLAQRSQVSVITTSEKNKLPPSTTANAKTHKSTKLTKSATPNEGVSALLKSAGIDTVLSSSITSSSDHPSTASQYKITGLVYDRETSEPIANAHVILQRDKSQKISTMSGADGRYTFEQYPGGSNPSITAEVQGYILSADTANTVVSTSPARLLSLPQKGQHSVEQPLAMVPAVKLSGHVLNPEGEPLSGASLSWNGTVKYTSGNATLTTSTTDGFFQFEVMPFQAGFVEVNAAGYGFHRSQEMTVSNEDVADIRLVPSKGGIIEGVVFDSAGTPVPGAVFEVSDTYTLGGAMRLYEQRKLATTDLEGSFRLENLSVGSNGLKVSADGRGSANVTFDIVAGDHKTGQEVRLKEELAIEGRVVGSDGKPTTAHINVLKSSKPPYKTNSDGTFKIGGLSTGEVTLHVNSHNPQQDKQVKTQAGIRDLVIKMDADAIVHARVVDKATGKPLSNFSAGGMQIFTDGEGPGGFRFFLTKGYSTYPKISVPGYVTKVFEVFAPKTEDECTTTLEMGIGAAVNGRILRADCTAPLTGVPVAAYYAHPVSDTAIANTASDNDGKFLLSGLPDGKLRIKALPKEPLVEETVNVELEDGKVQDAGEILCSAGAAIVGTAVHSGTREPITQGSLFVNGPEGTTASPRWDKLSADGTFKYENLKVGKYTVSVNASSIDVDLNEGETQELKFVLGNTKMQGRIAISGTTGTANIKARNLSTNLVHNGQQRTDEKGYLLTNLEPGSYEIKIRQSQFEKDDIPPLHQEIIQIPDDAVIQKDFIVP